MKMSRFGKIKTEIKENQFTIIVEGLTNNRAGHKMAMTALEKCRASFIGKVKLSTKDKWDGKIYTYTEVYE